MKDGEIISNIEQENINLFELDKVTIFGISLNELKEDGELFSVVFNIVNKAEGETHITLNYDEKDICNSKYEEIVPLGENSPSINIQTKTLTGIEIIAEPIKKEYIEGEELNTKGLKVNAKYSNGESEQITDYEILGYDSTQGTKTITVKYKEFTDSFIVTVFSQNENSLCEIYIDSIERLNNTFNLNITIKNEIEYKRNAIIVVAIYNKTNNKLISYELNNLIIENGIQKEQVSTNIVSSYEYINSIVKVFLWSSKNGMKPLSSIAESTISN